MMEICPISGEILMKGNYLLGFDLSSVHPIFKAKKSLILTKDMVFRFMDHKTSWPEKKLIFLAVLNTTELVHWQVPAKPEPYTMEFCFHEAIALASWIDYARHGIREKIQFPEYIVNMETEKMQNISTWLDSINDIKKIFIARDREDGRKREINERSQQIEVEFRTAGLIGQAFTLPLARWALELTDCPEGCYRKWLELLQTPLEEAWCLDREDLLEIQEHLQAELPVSNPQALAILVQIRKLVEATKWGFTDTSPVPGDDPESPDGIVTRPRTPRPNRPIFHIVQQSEVEAPENYEIPPEPKRLDFNKPHEYFAAKAKWELLKKELTGGRRGEYKQF